MSELTLASVLRKTEAGIAAFKSHDRSLPLPTRSLLIMVDGVKSLQDLLRLSPNPDSVMATAAYLIDNQLVTVTSMTAQASVKLATASSASAQATVESRTAKPDQTAGDLKTTIRKATRALEDLLGPNSEPLCLKIEKCRNMDEFAATIQSIRPVVASMRSESKALEFMNKAMG